MADPILLAKAASLAADKRTWKWLAVAALVPVIIVLLSLLLPVVLVNAIFAILNPVGDDLYKDPYYQAIAEVRASYGISNDLPVYVAKSIDLLCSGDILQSKEDAVPFIERHFVDSCEQTITREEVTSPTDPAAPEETETIYFFRTATEMLALVREPPYSFGEADIKAIQELYLTAEGGGGLEAFTGTLPMPVAGYITSGYGNRVDPLNGKYFMHPAIDIVPEWHSPVSTVADGTVWAVVTDTTYGNNVTIRHTVDGKVFYSFSAHLSRVDVAEGETLTQGQVIGLEGGDQQHDPNPGRTTGHHLHFEIWQTPSRTSHVNPMNYLKG